MRSKPTLEREVSRQFVIRARQRGAITHKISGMGRRGVWDMLIVGPGRRHCFVELKRVGGELSVAQRRFGQLLDDAKVPNYILWGGATREGTASAIETFFDWYLS